MRYYITTSIIHSNLYRTNLIHFMKLKLSKSVKNSNTNCLQDKFLFTLAGRKEKEIFKNNGEKPASYPGA